MQEQLVNSKSATYSRSEQVGWYFYDWANSAFSTTVVTAFMGPYLTNLAETAAKAGDGTISLLGFHMLPGAYWGYLVSLSVVLQVLFLPFLGALADFSNLKKQLLGILAYIGAFATIAIFFVTGDRYLLAGLLFLIANLTFGGSIVCYNAYLPEIASADERDRVSSQGWALGYLGGGLLLAVNVIFVAFLASGMGINQYDAMRICITSAGLWWALFTLIPLNRLKRRAPVNHLPPGQNLLSVGFRQLGHTLRQLPQFPQTLLFLIAYLLYNDGIQTVISQSSEFGRHELNLNATELGLVILMVQFVAFGGSLLFNYLAQKLTTKGAIMLSLVIWTGVSFYAWLFLSTQLQFYIMAAVIAVVLGGSQALSRSLFSLMIPHGKESEYFSLYEVSERGTSWMGPALFATAINFTGSYRIAILSIAVFFAAGLILLPFVNVRRAITEAGNQVPQGV
ncbi:MAG: MFS transporter [Caldilineaceae bacterium]